MTPHENLTFLLELLILLAGSRLIGELFRALKQPAVLGELLAGVLLGPTVLGRLAPGAHAWLFPTPPGRLLPPALEAFSMFGVTLMLLAAGLEVDLSLCRKHRKPTAYCALFGTVFPLAVGIGAGFFFADAWGRPPDVSALLFAFVLGINLAMSALPIISKTLLDLGIQRTRVGVVILASATIDDLGVWMLFGVALQLAGLSTGESGDAGRTILWVILLFGCALTVGRWAANEALGWIQRHLPQPSSSIGFVIVTALSFACAALWIGIHATFGSLLAGVVLGTSPNLNKEARRSVHDFTLAAVAPIFFASIGMRTDFVANFSPRIVGWTFALGCVGKLAGASLGARWGGLAWREAFAVGAGLNSRGIMGIVLGLVALQQKVIDERMFVALAVLGVGTSLLSGPLLRWTLGRELFEEAARQKSQDDPRA